MKKAIATALICASAGSMILSGCGSKQNNADSVDGAVTNLDGTVSNDEDSISPEDESISSEMADADYWYMDSDGLKNDFLGYRSDNDYYMAIWGYSGVSYGVGSPLSKDFYPTDPEGVWNGIDYKIRDGWVYLLDLDVVVEFDMTGIELEDGKTEIDALDDLGIVESYSDFTFDAYAYTKDDYIYCPPLNIRIKTESSDGNWSMPRVGTATGPTTGKIIMKTDGLYKNTYGVDTAEQAADHFIEIWSTQASENSDRFQDFRELDRQTLYINGHEYTVAGVYYATIADHYSASTVHDNYNWALFSDETGYCIFGGMGVDGVDFLLKDLFQEFANN